MCPTYGADALQDLPVLQDNFQKGETPLVTTVIGICPIAAYQECRAGIWVVCALPRVHDKMQSWQPHKHFGVAITFGYEQLIHIVLLFVHFPIATYL